MMLFGFGRVPGCLGLGALFLWDEWRDERTDCQRGGCMVVPGAVVSPGHTRRLRRLSCRAPHNSPCTLMPYLAQTDGAYSAACGRRVPSRQKPQALSMTSGLLRRTGSRPCSRPSGSPSCALERNKKDALQRNSGIVLSPSCTLERNKESIKVVINGLI